MKNKYYFRIGKSTLQMEYRAVLAWELIRSQGGGMLVQEAISDSPSVASDLVDNAFSVVDAFMDKVEYREGFRLGEEEIFTPQSAKESARG